MTNYLVQQGFSVVTESTGVGGLKRARELKPAAITLDIILPDVDGWTVIAALKGDPELAGIPVVIVSIVDEARRGIALGALGYLTKPIERDKLLGVLERFRGQNRQSSVLVVEDDPAQREVARSILAAQGWLVQEAANGRLALEALAGRRPDVVLLDLMMPEMDGFEFLAELRRHVDWRDIPVLVVTAMDLTDEARRRLNGGVERIIEKGGADEVGTLLREISRLLATSVVQRRPGSTSSGGSP